MLSHGYGNYWYPGLSAGSALAGLGFLLVPVLAWSLFWKGYALWKAAKNDNKGWFVALMIINTMGILDILYIYVFGAESSKPSRAKKRPK